MGSLPRGQIRPTTNAQAVDRARVMVGFKPVLPPRAPEGIARQPIRYRLSPNNGGKNPYAQHPADWSYGRRTPTCDCIGLVVWCLGFDRLQKGHFEARGGWANTDSILADAYGPAEFFEVIDAPELGCVVVYGSVRRNGRRRPGHIGLVVDPLPAEFSSDYKECWTDVRVIHCSRGNDTRTGAAVRETSAYAWRRRGVFLRYKKSAPEPEPGGALSLVD